MTDTLKAAQEKCAHKTERFLFNTRNLNYHKIIGKIFIVTPCMCMYKDKVISFVVVHTKIAKS